MADTGFLIATLVRTDAYNERAVNFLKKNSSSLVTTLPCITEALYMVASKGGKSAQDALLKMVESGLFTLADFSYSDFIRASSLMRQYDDAPMDFADASLVVAAERLGIAKILAFDAHFYAYRINGKTSFDVLPR